LNSQVSHDEAADSIYTHIEPPANNSSVTP
jgi:hypothetical protein